MHHLYQVQATALGGRNGSVATSDGRHRFQLSEAAAEGVAPDSASPEQLLAAGYAACFLSAIRSAADEREIKLPTDGNVTVRIGLRRSVDGTGALDFDFDVGVDLPALPVERAEELVAAAHQRCPFSRALARMTPVATRCG